MVVKHNLQAMNANRMLGITTKSASGSTEKLSSGYKINRAADDAAGLAISEKMRKQVRGLTKASANAEDGVSAVQTAEGALAEVHDMLQRMNELCVQAANGTNSESDRGYIQDEIEQLETEIDRIAQTTKFNEIYLLNGNGQTEVQTLEAHDAGLKGTLTEAGVGKSKFVADPLKVGDTVKIGSEEYNIAGPTRTTDYASMNGFAVKDGDKITQNGVTYTIAGDQTDVSATAGIDVLDSAGTKLKVTITEGAVYTTQNGKATTLVGANGIDFDGEAGIDKSYADWKSGDILVAEDGTEYTYVDADVNKYLSGIPHEESGFYKTVGGDIYEEKYTPQAGDIYTIKATGKKSSIRNDTQASGETNTGIVTVEDLQEVIKKLADGDTVVIHKNSNDTTGKTYNVKPQTLITSPADMTADDIAALIKEGQYVEAGGKKYYTIPIAATSSKDISLNRAYDMMAEEIKKASDIGADAGMQSTVKNNHDGTFEITHGKVEIDSPLAFNLHVGADADLTNKVTIDIRTITTKGLGLQGLNVKDKTGNGATYALDAVTDALRIVSTQRSLLGAAQNRLDHTINNLDNIIENTTAAEANIRDTDMAEEMVSYANTQVLMQAGQSILAQANQANQGVLSLLQ